jgi:uncharacterized repeat protein (TIGR03803 family)
MEWPKRGGADGDGTIFSIPAAGGPVTLLASFNGTDGAQPWGNLTLVGSTLYGMTNEGGANNDGTIFSMPLTGGEPTTLVSFDGTNGANPQGSLTFDGSSLYGVTSGGGTSGGGTVFALALSTPEPPSVGLGALGHSRRRTARRRREQVA